MSGHDRAPGYESGRMTAKDRPKNPNVGTVILERGHRLVYTGRNLWAWYPSEAVDLERFARVNGWGVRIETGGHLEFTGLNAEGDRTHRSYAKVVLTIGRESGPTKNGRTSKGYTYRLVWDTQDTGLFELRRWHRRTTTDPQWVEFGSVREIRSIISLNPVIVSDGKEANSA